MTQKIIDRGQGRPVVLVPGVQGRWEWMASTVDALARRCRVITYSLAGNVGDRDGAGFNGFVDQVEDVLDRAGLDRADVCGVSYGGLIALRFAARRPGRVSTLMLFSTPSHAWRPNSQVERCLRAPRLMTPVFVVGSTVRLLPEVVAAFDTWPERLAFAVRYSVQVAGAPFTPTEMADRVRRLRGENFLEDCRRVTAPTLVVTGEAHLDRVVPVSSTRELAAAISGAETTVLARTGHIGFASRAEGFASIVAEFTGRHPADREAG